MAQETKYVNSSGSDRLSVKYATHSERIEAKIREEEKISRELRTEQKSIKVF